MPVAEVLDRACAEAVDLAREAAEGRAGVMGVGEHLGVVADDVRVATHLFACTHPGYPGWTWQVTVARASRAKAVTVSEVTMLPGVGSLLAPRWVPWTERVGAGEASLDIPGPDDAEEADRGHQCSESELGLVDAARLRVGGVRSGRALTEHG